MSTTIIPFTYEDVEVRAVDVDGEPWFIASDVAGILGYANASAAIAQHVDDEDVLRATLAIREGSRDVSRERALVNESGLYALIFSSRLPNAREFRRWVTAQVLPAVRQHGGYLTEQKIEEFLTDPDTLIQLATQLKEERAARHREEKARQAVESYARDLEPRADGYDRFLSGDGSYSVGAAAKMLGLSQNKLFAELRNHRVLIAKGSMRNTPYQHYMHHFEVKAALRRSGRE